MKKRTASRMKIITSSSARDPRGVDCSASSFMVTSSDKDAAVIQRRSGGFAKRVQRGHQHRQSDRGKQGREPTIFEKVVHGKLLDELGQFKTVKTQVKTLAPMAIQKARASSLVIGWSEQDLVSFIGVVLSGLRVYMSGIPDYMS